MKTIRYALLAAAAAVSLLAQSGGQSFSIYPSPAGPGSAWPVSGTPSYLGVTSINQCVHAVTATSYTILSTDAGCLVTFNNASPVAVTLPLFSSGFWFDKENIGSGAVTVTPTSGTLNGSASSAFFMFDGGRIVSDGTNYSMQGGRGVKGGSNLTTAYSIPYVTSTPGQVTQLAPGTSGLPLISNGLGAPPSFGNIAESAVSNLPTDLAGKQPSDTLTGIIKSTGGVRSVAVAGTDYGRVDNLVVPGLLYSVSGIGTNTITETLVAQAANCFIAGPTSGGNAAPTCRAINPLDLPLASASQAGAVTTGTQTMAGAKTFSSPVTIAANAQSLIVGDGNNLAAYATFAARTYFGYDGTYAIIQGIAGRGIALNVNNNTPGGLNGNALRIPSATANVLIGDGTGADGNYRLDVEKSGSAGTARFFDQTAVTGATRVQISMGAADTSSTATLNSDASALFAGFVSGTSLRLTTGSPGYWGIGGLALPTGIPFGWVAGNNATASMDTGITRNAAGVAEINNGTAGIFRDLKLRSLIFTGTAAPTLANSSCAPALTNNTTLTWSCQGSDGVVRTVAQTLT